VTDTLSLHDAIPIYIKLPSIYNKRFNKDNYLEFEDEIDQYSFAENVSLIPIMELVLDGTFIIR